MKKHGKSMRMRSLAIATSLVLMAGSGLLAPTATFADITYKDPPTIQINLRPSSGSGLRDARWRA